MNEKLDCIFKLFSDLLDERFSSEMFTTEDSIRYLFFYACTENGVKPNDITLESKGIFNDVVTKHAELDMMIESGVLSESVAAEFKYHRPEGKDGKTKPQCYWAGKLLYDFYRLQNVKDFAGKRLSVYVASKEMQNRYTEMPEEWQLRTMMNLKEDENVEIHVLEDPKTSKDFLFLARTKGFSEWKEDSESANGFVKATVKCLFSKDYAGGNALRIFEIQ